MEIGKRISLPSSPGTSFDLELRDLLRTRCKLLYGVAFVIAAASYVYYHEILGYHLLTADTPFSRWQELIYYVFSLAFGLALIGTILGDWTRAQLQIMDHAVMTLSVILALFATAVLLPNEIPLFEVSLLLFTHAAIVPVRTGYQAGLALTASLGFPILWIVSYNFVPGIADYWIAHGGRDVYQRTLLEGSFSIAIMSAVSVLITRTLYNMRKSLHEARRMGSYTISRELGKGGMGQVFLAEHALMCRPAALKVLARTNGDAGDLARFEREVRLSASLTHPNTITIYDFGHTAEGTFFYAMEYLEGMDLEALIERFGPVSPERAVYVLIQACGSLAEAHSRGVIHRDVKPSNVFLTHRGGLYDFVKMLDFGLAKQVRLEGAATLTQSGVLFGTPRYMAPESVYGSDSVDHRADIYNLGGVGYWMITGKPPFESESPMEIIIDHVKTDPVPPGAISELAVPAELEAIIMRCLRKKPDERFQTAAELEEALRRIEFADPWSQRRAQEWWRLHAPEDERAAECYEKARGRPRPTAVGDLVTSS